MKYKDKFITEPTTNDHNMSGVDIGRKNTLSLPPPLFYTTRSKRSNTTAANDRKELTKRQQRLRRQQQTETESVSGSTAQCDYPNRTQYQFNVRALQYRLNGIERRGHRKTTKQRVFLLFRARLLKIVRHSAAERVLLVCGAQRHDHHDLCIEVVAPSGRFFFRSLLFWFSCSIRDTVDVLLKRSSLSRFS